MGTDEAVRSIFAVAGDNRVMVGGDFPQIELRIAAVAAKDEVMKNAFKKGLDLHCITAGAVAKIPVSSVVPEQRSMAKAVNFGFLYGMGARGFKDYAEQQFGVNVTLKEAEEARHSFFQTYSGIREWHNNARKLVQRAVEIDRRYAGSGKAYRTSAKTLSGRPIGIIPPYHRNTTTITISFPWSSTT